MRRGLDEMASCTKATQSVFRHLPLLASAHPCDDTSDPAEGRGTSAATPGEVPGWFFASCAAVSAIDSEIARRNCWRSVNCWVMAACFYFFETFVWWLVVVRLPSYKISREASLDKVTRKMNF